MRRRTAVFLTAAAVATAASAGGGWWWWKNRDAATQQWRTARVTQGALTAAVAATGTINPVASVSVGSQVSGQLSDVLVDFNSEVKAGQVIARIDPETFQQRVRQAQADLDAARAQVSVQQAQVAARRAEITRAEVNLADARLDLSRKEQLVARNFISAAERDRALSVVNAQQEDVRAARSALDVALAQVTNNEAVVKQRQAALAAAQVDVDRSVIRSPVDGVVIKRSVEPGQTVAASLQAPELFIIAKNLRDMQVDTAIDESDIGRIRAGQRATFTVDAFPGRSFEGSVEQVRKAATNVQNVVTYNVVVTFDNTDGVLLPGMTANVRIATERRQDVLMVPNAALRFRPPADVVARMEAAGAERGAGGPGAGNAGATGAGGNGTAGANGAAAGARGAQLAEFRSRLEQDLDLTAAQRQQLDAIFAAARQKFANLRTVPEDQRAKVVQANRAELRAQVGEILTPAQKPKYDAILAESAGRAATAGRGRLHLPGEDGLPRVVDVRTGISDGSMTEVSGRDVTEGLEVIVGVVGGGQPGGGGGASRPAVPTRLF